MGAPQRTRNPFINSSAGGRTLSALQLPLFLAHPPAGYAVLATTGRKTGKRRRRCIRAVPSGNKVYLVAIEGLEATGWAKNALAAPDVRLRLPAGSFAGHARELRDEGEMNEAQEVYSETVHWFDYLTWINWRKGRPTPSKIKDLLRGWLEEGTPLVIELDEP
jgi:deazaflavin-dependent oxidoreductase (nitroreductase family)